MVCCPGGRFPRRFRLLRQREFSNTFRSGRRIYLLAEGNVRSLELIYTRRESGDNSRLGLVVSKKCGNAVERNRIKRITRECFRRNAGMLQTHIDLVVRALPGCKQISYEDLNHLFFRLAKSIDMATRNDEKTY